MEKSNSYLLMFLIIGGFADEGTKVTCCRPGRVKGVPLPQEFVLSRMLANIRNPSGSWVTNVPACSWFGVQCAPDGRVVGFDCERLRLKGSVRWESLPYALRRFNAHINHLNGEIDLTRLPQRLESLDASYNSFEGTIILTELPPTMTVLNLSANQLSGWVIFSSLPPGLKRLCLRANRMLSGEVEKKSLPLGMTYCALQETKILGESFMSLI